MGTLPEIRILSDFWGHGCPVCGGAQLCPCSNCAPDHAEEMMWKWDESGELISCGHCGHTMHADGWLNLDMQRWQPVSAGDSNG